MQRGLAKSGGSLVGEILEETRSELREYFGAMNEVKAGIRSKIPYKPNRLRVYEATKDSGLPLLAGGLMDQPYIWIAIFEAISQEVVLYDTLESASNANRKR